MGGKANTNTRQRWEWRKVKNPESGGSGSRKRSPLGSRDNAPGGGQGAQPEEQTRLRQKSISKDFILLT